ncbi:MAG: ABC transporter permease [Chloroflexota bacterium]
MQQPDSSTLTVYQAGDDLSLVIGRSGPAKLFWIRFIRNKPAILGGLIIIAMVLMAILAPIISPYDPSLQNYSRILQSPSHAHLLGTDDLGRDTLSRIFFGARISVASSIIPVLIALGAGLPLGLIAGYFRGFWDAWVIMRVVDALQAFPFLILALALASVLGTGGFLNAMIAIGIGFTPAFVRIIRGQVLSVAGLEYVQSARALGVGNGRILRSHILPNVMGPLLVQISVAMAAAILAEAGLAFLGVGVQPGTPTWGEMLTTAQQYIYQSPGLAIWPGVAIFLAVLGFNLLGDGIRDGLDPRFG